MFGPWRLAAGVVVALLALPASGRQASDPRAEFVDALGRFSLALDGSSGGEGATILSALDAMRRALERWDAVVRNYEAAMAAEIGAAEPQLAARMHLALGGVYLDRHRVDAALRELIAARMADPNRADVQTLLGVAYSQLANDPAAAVEPLRAAASLDPGNPIRTYVLARHLSGRGLHEESGKTLRLFLENENLRAAVKKRSEVPIPFIRLGLVPEAADLEPFFPPVRYAAGFTALRRGEYDRALAAFDEAAASDPLVAGTGAHRDAMLRAAATVRDGAIEDAIEQLTTVIRLAPDQAEPRRILGLAYALDDRFDEAIDALREALRLDPRDERARMALIETLLAAGRLAEAHDALRDTMTALPESGRARYALARLYQRQGSYDEALRQFATSVTFNPLLGLNGIYETIGVLHAAQQNFDAAVAAYSVRVDLHPNDPEAHYDLGDIYLRQGRHDEALAEFIVVLLLNASHTKAAASMAQAHLRNGDHAAAAESARRALETDPAHQEARYVLATALIRLGETEAGRRELEIFQKQQAELAAARSRMFEVEGLRRDASVSAANGKHAETVALLRKVVSLEPSSVSHLELGLALLDADQPAEALEHLLNAAAKPNVPFDVHRYLAAAYQALGRSADSQREQAAYERIRREAIRRRGAGR